MKKAKVINSNIDEVSYDLPSPPMGKVYRNKITNTIHTGSIKLAMIYGINGKWFDEPIQEKPEDFELIDLNTEENG